MTSKPESRFVDATGRVSSCLFKLSDNLIVGGPHRTARRLCLAVIFVLCANTLDHRDSVGFAQTSPPPLKIRPTHPTNAEGADFSPPENAYNGPSLSAVGSFIRYCRVYCTGANDKETEWYGFPAGYRPERLIVNWSANAVFGGLAVGDTAKVIAKIEYQADGTGWNEMERFESTVSASTAFHDVAVALAPTVNTATVRVRASFRLELTCNVNCTGFSHAGGAANVNDIWIKARPALKVTTTPIVRGDTSTIVVEGAPGGSVASWTYETTSPLVGTIERTVNTTSTAWTGTMVASGTARATVTEQGNVYPLALEVTVMPRPWAFTAPAPIQHSNPYSNACNTLSANSPENSGVGGDAAFLACVVWDLDIDNIREIDDEGPNHGLKWIFDIADLTVADWVMHSDVENPNSPFYQHQCGDWVPAGSSTCPASGSPHPPGFRAKT